MIFVTPTPTIETYAIIRALNWQPANIYVNSVSATDTFMGAAVRSSSAATVNGSISTAYLKDPASPVWENDETMQQYKSIMAKYAPGRTRTTGSTYYGFAKADTFVPAMYKAGKNPTRQGLMAALLSLNKMNPYALPGVRLKTSSTDHYIISHQQPMRYNNGLWTLFGQLVDGRPRG